jgi:soluble lytic murein transglycosylase-like protein
MDIAAMILAVALEVGVPPYLALSVAMTENPGLDPLAVHVNADGTEDRGIMQLNSGWYNGDWKDPETNIRAGCEHLKWMIEQPGMNTWTAVVAYNCGYARLLAGPPSSSIEYANKVFERYNEYRRYKW